MKKVIIYLSIAERKGKKLLHLRDSNRICGDESIVTEVSHSDVIIWKKDNKSGIKSITDLKFEKSEELFDKSLSKKCCSKWKGQVSEKAKKEYPYRISFIPCESSTVNTVLKSSDSDDSPPPIIKIKD